MSAFVKTIQNLIIMDEIIQIDVLIDIIFVQFRGLEFQQMIGIPMGTNSAPLLSVLILSAYEADFLRGLLKNRTHFEIDNALRLHYDTFPIVDFPFRFVLIIFLVLWVVFCFVSNVASVSWLSILESFGFSLTFIYKQHNL